MAPFVAASTYVNRCRQLEKRNYLVSGQSQSSIEPSHLTEMSANLDLISTALDELVGAKISAFRGENIDTYINNNDVSCQFHKGIFLVGKNLNDEKINIFLNGTILEGSDGNDQFYLELSHYKTIENATVHSSLYYRKCRQSSKPSYFQIAQCELYVYQNSKNVFEPFALLMKSECEDSAIIRFDFPADGLQLSFSEERFQQFLIEDFFGKKLIKYETLSAL